MLLALLLFTLWGPACAGPEVAIHTNHIAVNSSCRSLCHSDLHHIVVAAVALHLGKVRQWKMWVAILHLSAVAFGGKVCHGPHFLQV